MSRLPDALLIDQAYTRGRSVPILDLKYGAQNGYAPNLAEWVSNTHYVRRNLVCLLIEAPRGFQYLPDPEFWVQALKAMVEVHAKTIDGLKSDLEVEYAETKVGGAGEIFYDWSNTTRAQSVPSFGFTDLYGRPIQNFIQDWITYLIGDPDSKTPMVSTLLGIPPQDMLADMSSATMLFFEPDPTHTKVDKAWLSAGMRPKGTGTIEGKRDLTTGGELSEPTIDFTATTQSGAGVIAFAQTLLDQINLYNANPNLRAAFLDGLDPSVAAQADIGYSNSTSSVGNSAILRS